MTEVRVSGGLLFLPQVAAQPGDQIQVRIAAQDVILARTRPEGLSALNILACTITEVRPGVGPGTAVQLRCGADLLLARVTGRSAKALDLAPGGSCYAVVKTVSVAKSDIA